MRSFLSSLNPRLPRQVQLLQVGGLMNAFGNGLVVPFLLIYLHNERGIGLGHEHAAPARADVFRLPSIPPARGRWCRRC